MEKQAVIYGVRSGDTYHYIGKTIQVNHEGKVPNSKVTRQYTNPDVREVFVNNEIQIDELSMCSQAEWYDEKLQEVVDKHKDEHPLLNAQWMLDGKRGYWEGTTGVWFGKKRDALTLKALSRSKYKRVCQYSVEGVLLEVWDGAKEAGIHVFGDYRIINNSGDSEIYKAISANTLEGHFRHGCYWFRHEDIVKRFRYVPRKLDIAKMLASEDRIKARRIKNRDKPTEVMRYTVLQYNEDGEVINRFENTSHCAYELKIGLSMVQKFCNGTKSNSNYILKYGEKTKQGFKLRYPRYKIRYKPEPKPRPPRTATRTVITVTHYHDDTIDVYDSTRDAALKLGLKESTVKRICQGKMKLNYRNYPVLRFGRKKKIVVTY